MALTTVDLPCATCPIVPAIDQGGGWVGRGGAMARVRQRGAWRGGGREEARVARRIERRTMIDDRLFNPKTLFARDRSVEARRGERSRGRTDVDRRLARDDLRGERRQRARVERLRVLHGEPVVADDVAHGERSLDARRRRLLLSDDNERAEAVSSPPRRRDRALADGSSPVPTTACVRARERARVTDDADDRARLWTRPRRERAATSRRRRTNRAVARGALW